MGQKVNPNVLRTGVIKSWLSNWYAKTKYFTKYLKQDYEIRNMVFKHFKKALLSKIGIERSDDKVRVILYTARSGIIFNTKLDEIFNLKKRICDKLKAKLHIEFKVSEVADDLDAKLISENIAFHLKKRVSFRKLMKRSVQQAIIAGAEGIKVEISGRLNGAEIARREWYREGRVPLHTLRANIDYFANSVLTKFGIMGIKIWIYKGEITHNIKYSLSEQSTSLNQKIEKKIIVKKDHTNYATKKD